jgi:hypothetical protein
MLNMSGLKARRVRLQAERACIVTHVRLKDLLYSVCASPNFLWRPAGWCSGVWSRSPHSGAGRLGYPFAFSRLSNCSSRPRVMTVSCA